MNDVIYDNTPVARSIPQPQFPENAFVLQSQQAVKLI